MSPLILKLPVKKKRGRKVTKGPKASVSVIYEPKTQQESSCRTKPTRMELEIEALAQIAARAILRKQEEDAWIESSRNVQAFPQSSRFRSLDSVARLKSGQSEFDDDDDCEDETDLMREMGELADRVRQRRDEILRESGHCAQ